MAGVVAVPPMGVPPLDMTMLDMTMLAGLPLMAADLALVLADFARVFANLSLVFADLTSVPPNLAASLARVGLLVSLMDLVTMAASRSGIGLAGAQHERHQHCDHDG